MARKLEWLPHPYHVNSTIEELAIAYTVFGHYHVQRDPWGPYWMVSLIPKGNPVAYTEFDNVLLPLAKNMSEAQAEVQKHYDDMIAKEM